MRGGVVAPWWEVNVTHHATILALTWGREGGWFTQPTIQPPPATTQKPQITPV